LLVLCIDFITEFGPDKVRKSGQAVSHITEWSSVDNRRRARCCAREKKNNKNAIRSRQ
jgi:hypothetical protein